ncbi:PREDICTED: uncharacterized protein LOC108365379 [Rhagoletis zephyria]|uniref:uncharacterized protein LOC108365379 n=1 Tax=Rhagoletis zephyria TaxID=28612 RepID=UPI00081174B5|nr:PREDICTED: uncharacterized protein LOC108365379 [Rhagoletis zephyria]XP_017474872.1 PREDICTED: uncharacterized protein LOC108365379 [Rhagoletis zephyria]XP_036320411.1 uncharacterized protein LOC118734844 [Rhagoletis pomonella]XP_036320412.1 uncharacterized protein LOC118734844 [Rhagoletis pomonella]
MEPASTTSNVFEEDEATVEWLHGENSNPSPQTPTLKRKNYLMTEILTAMKSKYGEESTPAKKDKYENFFALLGERLDRLPEHEVDEVQVEILQLVNRKLNKH